MFVKYPRMEALLVCLTLVLGITGLTDVPTLRVTRHPEGTTVQRGQRTDLYCDGEADIGNEVQISWRRVVKINDLNPVLESIPTGSDGRYVIFNATTSAFYFCVLNSGTFETISNAAYVEVTYMDEFAADGSPSDVTVSQPALFVELVCGVPASAPYPTVQWLKHSQPITDPNTIVRRNSFGQPTNLVIFDIAPSDSGVYSCEVKNELANTTKRTSDKATVTIEIAATTVGIYIPKEFVPDYLQTAYLGQDVELYVGVASKPGVTYTWEKDMVAVSGDRFTISDGDRTLKITSLTAADDGAYIVSYTQQNEVKGSTTISLRVIVPIEAKGDVWDYSTVLGEELVLTSDCQGSPPNYLMFETFTPGALWYKDGALLANTSSISVHVNINMKQTGVVAISSVKESDTGTYLASCFNDKAYSSFTKNILIANNMQAITISADKNGWGLVGSTITITCTAEGIPRPDVKWIKGGTPVKDGEFPRVDFVVDYTRTMFKTIARLIVKNAENTDSGMFVCKGTYTVRNQQYNAESESELIVAIPTSPRIQCLDTLAEEGTDATLVCAFSGVPLPDLNYRRMNGSDLLELQLVMSGTFQTNLSNLVIPNVKANASGSYRADATNVYPGAGRFDTLVLSISPASSRMSMNAIIGISVLVAFLLIGGLILAILLGRWKREKNFNEEMSRLLKERKDEVSDLQMKLQLRSMENRSNLHSNPLHQLPETRRQLPSFYAANIAVLAEAPLAKTLPPSLAALRKQRRAGTAIESVTHERTVSPSSVRTIMSSPADVEDPDNTVPQ